MVLLSCDSKGWHLVQEGWDVLLLLTSNQQKRRRDSALFCVLFLPRCKLRVQSSKYSSPWRGKQHCLMQN